MDIPTAPPCLAVELQPSTGRRERAGCSSGLSVLHSRPLQLLCRVGGGRLGAGAHPEDTDGPQSQGVLWHWTGMGMERSLPLTPSLPQPSQGGFKGLAKAKELIPMDFKLFSIF